MGILLESQYNGECKGCGEKYKKGDSIYYQKNDDGKRIVCTNLECFREQGGKLDSESDSEFLFVAPKNLDKEVVSKLGSIDKILNTILAIADIKTRDLYPHLKPDSNTFGQIRNSLVDKYISFYIAMYK